MGVRSCGYRRVQMKRRSHNSLGEGPTGAGT